MIANPLRKTLLILVLVSTFTTARANWLFDVETGSAWVGNADVQIPGDTGTPFNMADEMTPDDPQAFVRLRATWQINDRHEISGLYAPLSFDFQGSFDRDIDFAGGTFAKGQRLDGSYRFNSYRLTYRYNFYRTENLTLGLGLTAKVRDAKIELRDGGYSRSDSNVGLVPLINFKVDWRFAPRWHLLLDGDALAASQGRAEDVSLALQYEATERLAVRLGYRILEGGADNDDVNTFALFHYAIIGATYRF